MDPRTEFNIKINIQEQTYLIKQPLTRDASGRCVFEAGPPIIANIW